MASSQPNKPQKIRYNLGLDIGMASVGWALVTDSRIVDLGVRAFNEAETAKEGESLNLQRRMARLTRRRLKRRATRLRQLAQLFVVYELIADAKLVADQATHPIYNDQQINTWQLRLLGLDELLQPEEWARVIYHLCKHRGFYWVSRAEQKELAGLLEGAKEIEKKTGDGTAKEDQKVKQGLKHNRQLMAEKSYRSIAEMVLKEHQAAQRNKQGEYTKALPREMLAEELALLFANQRELGNKHATSELEEKVLGKQGERGGLFWQQKAALSGEDLLKMLGKCTFEKDEYRAPKHSFSAECHVWLTRLNNLRINQNGRHRELTKTERAKVIHFPYAQASDFTYKQLRSALSKAGSDLEGATFVGLRYPRGNDEKTKDPETTKIISLKGWHTLRKIMKDGGLEHEWSQITSKAFAGNPELLDSIAWVLSVYKEDAEVTRELRKLDLGSEIIDCLLDVRFDKFHNLSLKALGKIIPSMEEGKRYDEACLAAGYHHSMFTTANKTKYLPPLYQEVDKKLQLREDLDLPRNPVVLRSLNQTRKVVNAIIKKYGSPDRVHIEMARDIGKPKKERDRISKDQESYRQNREQARNEYYQQFRRFPVKDHLEKYLLYREQDGQCAYSLTPINIDRLFDTGYTEIDHILPWSRSYDDSKNNKVLVLTEHNRDKGNRTPWEFFGSDTARWHKFENWINGNKKIRTAKASRLTKKDLTGENAKDFRERNLNDTRYACRFFKNFVQQHLLLHEESASINCIAVAGLLTSLLRMRWGLLKDRAANDRHHALDAVVVACCSQGMVQKASNYAQYRETRYAHVFDPETGEILNETKPKELHFPQPWDNFREELQVRLGIDDKPQLEARLERLGNYTQEEIAAATPLLVSRAPQRRNSGAAHKETIYAKAASSEASKRVIKRTLLSALTRKDMDNLVDRHCNQKLYAAMKQRLEAHGGKGDKAFAEPFYKPDKQGNPTGPIVRSVKKYEVSSGIGVRGGVAANDTMVRVDVFSKDGKYYLIPVYVHQRGDKLPNRAVVSGKDEEDWTLIDDSFAWNFSLYPNDYIKISRKSQQVTCGYFAGLNRSSGNCDVWLHDRDTTREKVGTNKVKAGCIEGIGVKSALAINKYHVDVLGNLYPARLEARRELA